jgi:hypothetical protein
MTWVVVSIIWVITFTFTMALMKAASDADDYLLGGDQYIEN